MSNRIRRIALAVLLTTLPTWDVREAWIVTLNENGRYPSDHFPVMAVVDEQRP